LPPKDLCTLAAANCLDPFASLKMTILTSIHIDCLNIRPSDAEKLIRFFEAIGLRRCASHPTRRHSALFSVAAGAIGINMLSAELSGEGGNRLSISVANPDVILQIAQKFNFKIVSDSAHRDTPASCFSVKLPGGIVLDIFGGPPEPPSGIDGKLDGKGKRFAVVVSRFNAFITERLLHGALDALRRTGARTKTVVRVPGAFEIPLAARSLASSRRYDAIICIGCLLRGDTAHYDVIVNEVTRGIGQSAQETGVPHAFGVLTCDTLEQAIDRAGLKMGNKGFEAALAAVEMASLKTAISSRPSALGKSKSGNRSPRPRASHKNKRQR
jgi:6,7-dimethyl-8-ribityllumazine synthase